MTVSRRVWPTCIGRATSRAAPLSIRRSRHVSPTSVNRTMASSITARYAAGVAGGRVERDAAQVAVVGMLAQLEERLVEHRLARKSSSLGWLFASRGKNEALPQGPLHLRRCRPRQNHADGFVLRGQPGAKKAPRAFSRIHDRRARARSWLPAKDESRRACRRGPDRADRESSWRAKPGCSASMNSTSPTSPTP